MNRNIQQTYQSENMNNTISNRNFTRNPLDEEDSSSSSDRMKEGDSIMAVWPTTMPLTGMNKNNPSPPYLPLAPFYQPVMEEDDDISVLTEFSMVDDDEDAVSQVTARTVVTTNTTGTDSTTIPRRNISQVKPQPTTAKRHHGMLSMQVPHDNRMAKRRRKR